MNRSISWTRRDVLKGIAMSSGASLAPKMFALKAQTTTKERYVFVACPWKENAQPGIELYAVTDEAEPVPLFFHASDRPSALALNQARDRLYVANGLAQTDYLPCGSVETYAVQWQPLQLKLLRRTRLAIGSTLPDGLALSPDGALLIANCSASGLLNAMPLDEQGCAASVTAVHKRLRRDSSEDGAAEQRIWFGCEGKLMVSARGERSRSYLCDREFIRAAELDSLEPPAEKASNVLLGSKLQSAQPVMLWV